MARVRPRQIFPGATYLVTRRCTQRQFLLVPNRRTTQIFHYCLAYAVRRTGVEVHAVVVMSNHYHLVVTDPGGVLPLFVECLNKLVAKCVNASLGRWENFWASEPASYVRLLDADAVIDKLAYLLANPVDAALVEHGREWPGLRLGRPGSYPARRPDIFFREAGTMPKSIKLELVPPPGLAGRDAQKRINEAVAERERDARTRIRREGRSFLGVRAVLRQNPFASPVTFESKRQLSPQIASRNKWLRIETLTRCAEFVREHRRALAGWLKGKRNVVFPAGTYLMRIRHNARCAET